MALALPHASQVAKVVFKATAEVLATQTSVIIQRQGGTRRRLQGILDFSDLQLLTVLFQAAQEAVSDAVSAGQIAAQNVLPPATYQSLQVGQARFNHVSVVHACTLGMRWHVWWGCGGRPIFFGTAKNVCVCIRVRVCARG
jgi:hypothetical protein